MGTCVAQTVAEGCSLSFGALRFPALTLGITWEFVHRSPMSKDSLGSWERCMGCKGKSLFSAGGVAFFFLLKGLIQMTLEAA